MRRWILPLLLLLGLPAQARAQSSYFAITRCFGANVSFDCGDPDNNSLRVSLVASTPTLTVGLPSGASTAANQTTLIGHLDGVEGLLAGSLTTSAHDAAFGTAGSADSQVRTIQGIASMTPVQVSQATASNLNATVTAVDLDVQSGGTDILSTTAFNASLGTAGSADSQVQSIQGIASMTPVQVQSNSANVATETTLGNVLTSSNYAAAFGTAGTADSQVMSVQGIASMTPVQVSQATASNLNATVTAVDLDVQSGGADILSTTAFNASLGTAGSADSQVQSIQGIASMTPVQVQSNSANVATETTLGNVLTSANFAAAFGTAGTADSQVMSVQGISSMTPLQVQSNSANLATETTLSNAATSLGALDNIATGLSYIAVGSTEDEHAVKASAGTLWSIAATNTNAAVVYLKCENDTTAGTAPGTDTPEFRLAIPGSTAGGGFVYNFPRGRSFSTAWTCWIVTGAADADVAEVSANSVIVDYTFE